MERARRGGLGDAGACALVWPLPAACGQNVCARAEAWGGSGEGVVVEEALAHYSACVPTTGWVLGWRLWISAAGEVMKLILFIASGPTVKVKKGMTVCHFSFRL